jgi:hypothetical protein
MVRRLARAGASGISGHVFIVFADLAHDVVEGVVDVYSRFGGCFDEFAAKLSREFAAL